MHTFCVLITALAMLAGSTVGVVAQSGDDPTARPPIPSAGCGAPQVEPGTHSGQSMLVGDLERTWVTHVPAVHDGLTPLPLWLQLHGCCGGSGFNQVFKHSSAADEQGVLLVGPDSWFGNGDWTFDKDTPVLDASLSNPDVAFVGALIDRLGDELCIDLARVYAAGYSAGGEGSSVLGCVLEDRIAAVASVAAMLDVGEACELDRAMPFIAVHGTKDSTAYFDGGYQTGFNDWPVIQAMAQASIPERVANVAARNGCEPEPRIEALDEDIERWSWSCPVGADVVLVAHDGWHDWPPDATDLVWQFFEQHPMPE